MICPYIHVMDKDHNPLSYIRFGSYNFFSSLRWNFAPGIIIIQSTESKLLKKNTSRDGDMHRGENGMTGITNSHFFVLYLTNILTLIYKIISYISNFFSDKLNHKKYDNIFYKK
jgi:hypothetical protein